jgi:hypothetical protein
MLDELKAGMVHQRSDVVENAGEEIVDAYDSMAMLDETIAEMRTDEASASRH